MDAGQEGTARDHAVDAFVAELQHWRQAAGHSQKALAERVGYTPSYVSKVERGTVPPSREFAEKADHHLRAGGALLRRWRVLHGVPNPKAGHMTKGQEPTGDPPQSAPGELVVIRHELARLTYADGRYRTEVMRDLANVGTDPVTQYLIRVLVDRYPGEPERSNSYYREHPLTWDEIRLSATCEGEPMAWRAKLDRDAHKEAWLLFENHTARFPLYPGQTKKIRYCYAVGDDKWGQWWQRSIRLRTIRLTMVIDLPTDRRPVVWGVQTSMTAKSSPFQTPFHEESDGNRSVFTWSTENPPLHTRFRAEWKFGQDTEER